MLCTEILNPAIFYSIKIVISKSAIWVSPEDLKTKTNLRLSTIQPYFKLNLKDMLLLVGIVPPKSFSMPLNTLRLLISGQLAVSLLNFLVEQLFSKV